MKIKKRLCFFLSKAEESLHISFSHRFRVVNQQLLLPLLHKGWRSQQWIKWGLGKGPQRGGTGSSDLTARQYSWLLTLSNLHTKPKLELGVIYEKPYQNRKSNGNHRWTKSRWVNPGSASPLHTHTSLMFLLTDWCAQVSSYDKSDFPLYGSPYFPSTKLPGV